MYLLDTNIVVALLRGDRQRSLRSRVLAHPPGEVATSAIVAHELYFGAAASNQPAENSRRLVHLFEDLEVLPYTPQDAEVAGEIRAALKAAGTPIGPYDTLIAGQAKARGLTLATNNTREFARVEGLALADWLREEGA